MKFTNVEKHFLKESEIKDTTTKVPYITVDSFPKLGFFTALRFIEWVAENPDGVISLPIGKTAQHFIHWTKYILENWDTERVQRIREKNGLTVKEKPSLKNLHFVQMDEFYPINSSQHNSSYYYVNEQYIKGFGLDPNKALLINCNEIPLAEGKTFSEIFPNNEVDLSLRNKDVTTQEEKLQQESIFMIDDWCANYEKNIREKGGIGFFLGTIGPDGHVAYNTRGSDHFSTTRLTGTNYETQAQAATDLGGIEVSRKRLVITIGLDTIVHKKDAVAIIFVAGEANADVLKDALENEPSVLYPTTVLQKIPNSRFYITNGAAVKLKDSVDKYFKTGEWTEEKIERAIIELCKKINKYGPKLELSDLQNDEYCKLIPNLSLQTVKDVIDKIDAKIQYGLKSRKNEIYYHTGPHHDDIALGLLPYTNRLLRENSNESYFTVATSGFNSVTNHFVASTLNATKKLLNEGKIQMVNYPDFFETGYTKKKDKDVYHYLIKVASDDPNQKLRGLCHRVVRAIVEIWECKSINDLRTTIDSILTELSGCYDGEKNSVGIQKLKGRIREFEEELIWAHSGVQVSHVHHLRLGFYTSSLFAEKPDNSKDVNLILDEFKKIRPNIISLALDPEGSGPDTHYKVLQIIADAVREWDKQEDLSNIKIWGYRNVWFKFQPSDVKMIVPVSLNALDVLDKSFTDCYLSQVNASFPSPELDGKFSALAQRNWVNQLNDIQYLMGKDYFYENKDAKIRASHGLIYVKEMTAKEFINHAKALEKSMESVD